MTIEQSWLNGSTDILPTIEPYTIFESVKDDEFTDGWKVETFYYKFRYTVHRQYVGFFTPMIFDVSFHMLYKPNHLSALKTHLEKICEPFVEGALFVNHTSSTLVEFFKGTNFGFNRLTLIDNISKQVTTPKINGFVPVWYSDWMTPPITIQNQRIFSYDMENSQHGSMLDPTNVVEFIMRYVNNWLTDDDYQPLSKCAQFTGAYINAGYTEKVTQHVRD